MFKEQLCSVDDTYHLVFVDVMDSAYCEKQILKCNDSKLAIFNNFRSGCIHS